MVMHVTDLERETRLQSTRRMFTRPENMLVYGYEHNECALNLQTVAMLCVQGTESQNLQGSDKPWIDFMS
jgi:hypothetical protein